MNFVSRLIIGFMLKTDTVNLVNIVAGNSNIPECIGSNFKSEKLFLEMVRVYSNSRNQIEDFETTMDLLGISKEPPNVRAANSLLSFCENFKTV